MQQANLPQDTWQPGTVIPGTVYRITRVLGRGGMGEVFEVEHTNLGIKRALKVLLSSYAGRDDLTRRLKIEATGLAKIKHPNLVEVYDLGSAADGRIFFAMELLDGTTLRHLVRETGRMRPVSAVTLMVQVLDGLAAAHREGMLHRDIKPENIFVCRSGTVKLLDFGVAKAIHASLPSDDKITIAGTTVGTPRYMSVEQAEGDEVDARADVYSAGLVLWELLVGHPAFEQNDLFDLVDAKRSPGVPNLLGMGIEGIDSELAGIVARACAVHPRDRIESAASFAAALRQCTGVPTLTTMVLAGGLGTAGDSPTPSSQQVGATQVIQDGVPPEEDDAGWGMSRAILQDLTQRIDSAAAINRGAVTRAAHGLKPAHFGPAGTEVLPAVRAQRAAQGGNRFSEPSDSSPSFSQDRHETQRPRASKGQPRGKTIALALVVFLFPVLIGVAAVVLLIAPHKVHSTAEVASQRSLPSASPLHTVGLPTPASSNTGESRDSGGSVRTDAAPDVSSHTNHQDAAPIQRRRESGAPSTTPKHVAKVPVASKATAAPAATKRTRPPKLVPTKHGPTKPAAPAEPILPASGL